MFDYLQQFNKLPKELREKVSSPAAMDVLLSLEKKYGVNLAMLVMQVMIKQLMFKDLPAYFSTEIGLNLAQAEGLTKELREKLFFSVATYLGLKPVIILNPEEKSLELLMKENNIILPSQELLARCRNILLTYRKGVRSKMDTRLSLEKAVAQGGLGLDMQTAERLLRAADRQNFGVVEKQIEPIKASSQISPSVQSEVDQLINRQEAVSAYNLKKNIEQGELKIPEVLVNRFQKKLDNLDLKHEIEAPDKVLSLTAPDLNSEQKIETEKKAEEQKSVVVGLTTPPSPPLPPSPQVKAQTNIQLKPKDEDYKKEISVSHSAESATIKSQSKIEVEKSGQQELLTGSLSPDKVAAVSVLKPSFNGQSFKKPNSSSHSSLFSRFLPDKNKEVAAKKAIATPASHNLEEMVKTASLQSQLKSRPAAASDARPKMEDVKLRPKVMGPLEELRYLDIVNFRRLGDSPEEITKKIIAKIRLLDRNGYDYLVQGVKAWRQSPVNKTYIHLIQEAVNKGITLNEVLEIKKSANKESLNKEEIAAIIAMNSKLMF